jgi:hypothetical protein
MRTRYNMSEIPPAPYITLEIAPSGRRRKPIRRRAKIDSGASMTLIPESLPKRWRLPFVISTTLRAYDGQDTVRPLYLVDIIGSRHFQDVWVTVVPRRHILLGRDILNQLHVTLNGPQQTIEIHDA